MKTINLFFILVAFVGGNLVSLGASELNNTRVAGLRSKSLSQFLEKENKPLKKSESKSTSADPQQGLGKMAVALAVVLCLAALMLLGYKLIRNKPIRQGDRKFLIEKLSYCSVGPKMGVCLLKVGSEFVLVGVTPHNITPLSPLTKLQAQYEEESKFERENFQKAVENEFHRIKQTSQVQV